jgi:hypothetical protein
VVSQQLGFFTWPESLRMVPFGRAISNAQLLLTTLPEWSRQSSRPGQDAWLMTAGQFVPYSMPQKDKK